MWRTITITALLGILTVDSRWAKAAVLGAPAGGTSAQSSSAPYEVEKQIIRIPMKDGVRLSAWLFKPVNAPPGTRFPALLKFAPYRNDDNPANIADCEEVKDFVARGYVGAC